MNNLRKFPMIQAILMVLGISVFITGISRAQSTYSWTSGGSGNWSNSLNWTCVSGSGTTFPGTTDTGQLLNVGSGTQIVNYDSGACATISTLMMTQTTAGATNEFELQKTLSITNALTIGATAGTSLFYFSPGTSNIALTLADANGITINSGGIMDLEQFNATALASIATNTTLTISGGTLDVERSEGASSTANYGNITMTSGTMALGTTPLIGTPTGTGDRMNINGNLTLTGGTVTGNSADAYMFQLNGLNNIISNLASFNAANVIISLNNGGASTQILNVTSTTVGAIYLRGSSASVSIKQLSTNTSGTVGALSFLEGTAGGTVVLQLESNVTLTTGAAEPFNPNYSQPLGSNITCSIDPNGYVLDLSTGAGAGAFIPNQGMNVSLGYAPVWWVLGSGAGGTIKAGSFDLLDGNGTFQAVNTTVSGPVILQAVGGNGTSSKLGNTIGAGTISATSTFLYSGSAVSTNPSQLTSNRSIGILQIQNGYLNINQASLTTGGAVSVTNSGGLILNGTSGATPGTLTLATGVNFTLASSGVLDFKLGGAGINDAILGNGGSGNGGLFSLSGGVINLLTASGLSGTFSYGNTYNIFQFFATSGNTVTGETFEVNGGALSGYTASISQAGVLSFAAVPEPGTNWLLLVGGLVLGAVVYWHKRTAEKFLGVTSG